MRQIALSLAVFILSLTAYSQSSLNSDARLFINKLEKSKSDSNLFNSMIKDYDLIKINQNYHVGALALVDLNKINEGDLEVLNVINDSRIENLWSLRVPVNKIEELVSVKGINYIEIGNPVHPDLSRSLPSARVDSVHSGLGGLAQAYTGKGVIVAIIDWGFDYTHPMFYDTTLTDLRLSRAWDQNKLSGPAPEGYSFGTEFVGTEALLAAECDTIYVFGSGSHGTHVGGIAAGSGGGTEHRGVAIDSEIIFISLRRDAPSLIDAFTYVTNYAAEVGKPYVINMSFGSHLGPHDGTSLKNLGIDLLHGPGRIFVGSAGNNGDTSGRFHLDKNFIENPGDTLITVVQFANVADMFGQTLSMWGSEFSDFSAALRVVDNNDSTIHQTDFYNSIYDPLKTDTVLLSTGDTLIYRIQSNAGHFINNKPNIRLEVKLTGSNKLVLLATSDNSHLHIWNNVRMNNRYTNWGVNLSDNYPGAVQGNQDYGVGEPAGVGKSVITVGSYGAERPMGLGGRISGFSSYGPTVDYRTKPDIASVGDNVVSAVNSFNPNETNYHSTVEFNGRTYPFAAYSGTSMSGPTVSGIVALMLEAYPQLSAYDAREILKNTARLDEHTGDIGEQGDLRWGWGKANALAAVKAAEIYKSTPGHSINSQQNFRLYPNPASDIVHISQDAELTIDNIKIYCINGKLVKSIDGFSNHYAKDDLSINIGNLTSGKYIVIISTSTNFSIKRLVIN